LSTIEPYAKSCAFASPSISIVNDDEFTFENNVLTECCTSAFGSSMIVRRASSLPADERMITENVSVSPPAFTIRCSAERAVIAQTGTTIDVFAAAIGSIDWPYVPPPSFVVYVRLVTTDRCRRSSSRTTRRHRVCPNVDKMSASTSVLRPSIVSVCSALP
jgi:hypothetical protein